MIQLITEEINKDTQYIHQMSTEEIVKIINEEDKKVANAVQDVLPRITEAVDIVVHALQNGGHLYYIGAGTSGRLGVLDAAECPPTYNTPPELVRGIIAGGEKALLNAVEGIEDDVEQAVLDLKKEHLSSKDVVIGIAASGRTPYVSSGLKYARSLGAKTVSISCNPVSEIARYADVPIEIIVGPEVVTGSTRLKAGTAQKMVLNMISTTTMIKLGKVYQNYMIDLQASNNKLKNRAKRILGTLANIDEAFAEEILIETQWNVKEGLVMVKGNVTRNVAKRCLLEGKGFVDVAIELAKKG
ncbi:MAG TPA: N-acetylmuramic acid 6-phosphate etherase [Ureibacillus sp.]|nr:N-acetylmuramic acid 6-phosphate etherase [Ureibacillus sp.]